MPELVKVGFSTKDPELRATELAHTGAPHPYVVEFDILVENPHEIEQRAHAELSKFHERKEWFRCSVDQAISAIQTVAGNSVLLERKSNGISNRVGDLRPSRKPVDFTPIKHNESHSVGTYRGTCTHCRHSFTVTLSAPASQAKCPECLRQTDLSTFSNQRFLI